MSKPTKAEIQREIDKINKSISYLQRQIGLKESQIKHLQEDLKSAED